MGSPVADRVERILKQQDRSITWLAKKADVSVSYAWMMLRGERTLTDEFKAAAVEALGVPADILFPDVPAEAAS